MPDVSRGTSPVLLGRDAEIARLRAAIAAMASGAAGVVLISGEAGIGKSRLLAEWEASAIADPPGDRGIRFLHASCIEVGERLAFLPILDWLHELRDTPAHASAAEALLVAFGGSDPGGLEPARSTGEAVETNRAARFSGLRDLLMHAAEDRTVVAVIDDLHWADRSTLDVVTFLARRLAGTGVLLAAAYRSDELHRRHPLTAPLADLERHSTLDHVSLEPLDPGDVARQIAAIEGDAGDPTRAARVVELADGNPFHVEELLAIDRPGPLPSTLRDVLASRLGDLDDATLAVIREAAVIGRLVDAELLVAVSRGERDAVGSALRAASDARILLTAEDGRRVRFRHALLREAVYDDVLASERVELHRRIAVALTERPDLRDPSAATASAELARHWLASGAIREAFAALLTTATASARAAAWAEARWALDEALALWDRLPDARELAGQTAASVLGEAATFAWYQGDSRRALELNQRAQREPEVAADPIRLGSLLIREAWYRTDYGDLEGSRAAVERAVAIIPADPPTSLRATALGTLGVSIATGGSLAEGIERLDEAVRISTELSDGSEAATNLAMLGPMYASLGRESDALAAIGGAISLVEAVDSEPVMDANFFAIGSNEPWVWLELGDEAGTIESVERNLAAGRRRGVETSIGPWLVAPQVLALFRSGRWDEAIAAIDTASTLDPTLGPVSFTHAVRARILAGRGRFDEARRVAGTARATARRGWFDEDIETANALAWIELLAGDPKAAATGVHDLIERLPTDELTTLRAEVAWMAAWTSADGAALHDLDRPDRARLDALATFARQVVEAEGPGDPAAEARRLTGLERFRRLAAAELGRAEARDGPETWSTLAADLDAIENPVFAAIARLREGAARLSNGEDRATVAAALRVAQARASAAGASVLLDRVRTLARAGRIELDGAALEPAERPPAGSAIVEADPWGLSGREREVLGLLMAGRTNAQIGQALYISDKTASVHVTHILDKLGVASRVEAALLAVRVGFVAPVDVAD